MVLMLTIDFPAQSSNHDFSIDKCYVWNSGIPFPTIPAQGRHSHRLSVAFQEEYYSFQPLGFLSLAVILRDNSRQNFPSGRTELPGGVVSWWAIGPALFSLRQER